MLSKDPPSTFHSPICTVSLLDTFANSYQAKQFFNKCIDLMLWNVTDVHTAVMGFYKAMKMLTRKWIASHYFTCVAVTLLRQRARISLDVSLCNFTEIKVFQSAYTRDESGPRPWFLCTNKIEMPIKIALLMDSCSKPWLFYCSTLHPRKEISDSRRFIVPPPSCLCRHVPGKGVDMRFFLLPHTLTSDIREGWAWNEVWERVAALPETSSTTSGKFFMIMLPHLRAA